MLELDHLLWSAPDLGVGVDEFERLTGVRPAIGGAHPGRGTRNALAAFQAGLYFEIIAPDPSQTLAGTLGAQLAAQPGPGLYTFALRTRDIGAVRRAAAEAGVHTPEPLAGSRRTPSGELLSWTMLDLEHPLLGPGRHFALDWGNTPHPSTVNPPGCRLVSFCVLRREPEALSALYRALGVPVEVKRAARDGFHAELATPRGALVLREAGGAA